MRRATKSQIGCSSNRTSSLSLNTRFSRVGVIPFVSQKDNIYFFLALWKGIPLFEKEEVQQLGDFGGSPKDKENFLETAARELNEESLGLFRLSASDICKSSYSIWNEQSIVIFVPVRLLVSIEECNTYFQRLKNIEAPAVNSVISTVNKISDPDSFILNRKVSYIYEEIHEIKPLLFQDIIAGLENVSSGMFYNKVSDLLKNEFMKISAILFKMVSS